MADLSQALQQAQYFLTTQDFDKAIEITSDLIEKPDYLKVEEAGDQIFLFALQIRCAAYFGHEDYADSMADAEMLIRLLPNTMVGYFYRGSILLQFDEIKPAIDDFQHLLKFSLPPMQEASVTHSLGLAEYIAGHYDLALKHYLRAIQLTPDKDMVGPIYSNMGIVYFRQNDMAAAWNAYRTAQELNPTHDHILVGLAVLHAAEGEWDEALKIWRKLFLNDASITDPDAVAHRYYRWTPPMAELTRQIIDRL
jgi:tetratricopeptide (TPR) repeat protein